LLTKKKQLQQMKLKRTKSELEASSSVVVQKSKVENTGINQETISSHGTPGAAAKVADTNQEISISLQVLRAVVKKSLTEIQIKKCQFSRCLGRW
jgi:hypothetical protein